MNVEIIVAENIFNSSDISQGITRFVLHLLYHVLLKYIFSSGMSSDSRTLGHNDMEYVTSDIRAQHLTSI